MRSSLKRKINLVVAGTCVLYFFSGCAKAPDAELAAATAAVKAAQNAEADKYMAKNYQIVLKAMKASEDELAKQKSSFFLTRKYKRATSLLVQTTTLATEIATEAPKAKAEITATVKENLTLAKTMLKGLSNDITRLKKKNKALFEELKADLSAADSATISAAADFDAGNTLAASEKLATVQQTINKITRNLQPPKDM
jgi:hypothetical protein